MKYYINIYKKKKIIPHKTKHYFTLESFHSKITSKIHYLTVFFLLIIIQKPITIPKHLYSILLLLHNHSY